MSIVKKIGKYLRLIFNENHFSENIISSFKTMKWYLRICSFFIWLMNRKQEKRYREYRQSVSQQFTLLGKYCCVGAVKKNFCSQFAAIKNFYFLTYLCIFGKIEVYWSFWKSWKSVFCLISLFISHLPSTTGLLLKDPSGC